ncbi:ATP-binding cassette domain-containing protein [Mesorhizobium sp. CO1-1-7]|uniref:ABC transporter ATP-binding protein n=1 Tax=unclassified Mesorhizobium TaxID=325217 RepID=UPI001129203B|nr:MULTISPECIES: ATP-binding cassette domain-containing protein [unclassified Mesorhizobium]MBZ9931400.1 ATP-binding cassette domain-containing protein [Mesorhizobium sp. BR1-1-5]MBZ9683175.1 ATP-binding cassette domain-containing protein [Mesorhizobium sp. CO1-1-2]MBZ9698595.1 ATP-binding cassette domain-containing protein [Mesorhizobium sp. CO1-1-9]MBZ9743814.1 ATP-binding cassette domain-containing protein [Mesorhizobium sp. CO1-1-7]MBZ9908056.1 ATP-binding cassette domain-containing protei
MALLELDDVSKAFGSLKAVDGVSFKVEAGEIFGIAGPNGSGKSTLFNIITGIPFGPDRGHIRFDGTAINGKSGHAIARLGLARTFQRETSFDGLTVFENALIGASYGRKEKAAAAAAREAAAEALEFVGLGSVSFGRLAGELSVFERKCLMLATAIAMQPRMLLLDEPASSLTKPEIETSIGLIRRTAERGITILLIEHVLTFLMSLSQHLLVLNNGRVLAAGEPASVIADQRVIEAYLGTRRAVA